jgi:hypothetical protein
VDTVTVETLFHAHCQNIDLPPFLTITIQQKVGVCC